jgi:hypothetical protein
LNHFSGMDLFLGFQQNICNTWLTDAVRNEFLDSFEKA